MGNNISVNKQADMLVDLLNLSGDKKIESDENKAIMFEQGIINKVLSTTRCEVIINGETFEMDYSSRLTLSKGNVVVVTRWNEDIHRRWVTDLMPSFK